MPTEKLLAIILISSLGIIVYSNSFQCSFHFDDLSSIINNLYIRDIHHLKNIWGLCPCRFITFLSFAFNYHCNQLNVFGYHLFNVIIHLGSALLVWWLTLLTLSTPAMRGNKITQHSGIIALLAGLVFVSHPLQTEAVTYIWQRAASMATLFYLASLCLYIKSRLLPPGSRNDTLRIIYYTCALITAIVAMFTKEITVTLPLMILLYEFFFFEIKNLPWKRLCPFLITLLIIPLTILLTRSDRFQEIKHVMEGPGGISPLHYLLTQFRVVVTYIRLAFLPLNQNLDYDYSISKSIFEWPILFSFLFLMTILFAAKRLFFKYRLMSFSIFWFFLTLLPESSILPLEDVIFEHRLYLPLVGYSIFLVSGLYYLFGKNSIKTMIIVLIVIIAGNSILTYQRNKIWKDELTLWTDAVHKSPHKARAYNNRGLIYDQRGDLRHALSDYNNAIKINPNFADAYTNRGLIFDEIGNFSQALFNLNKAIEIDPHSIAAYTNRGHVYDEQKKLGAAVSDFSKAIQIDPSVAAAYINRGLIYNKLGKLPQALSDFNKAIQINPNNAEVYNNRGVNYDGQGNLTQALSDFNKAIQIKPNYAQAYNNRAVIYYQLKKYGKSFADVNKVETLGGTVHPDFINALKVVSGEDK